MLQVGRRVSRWWGQHDPWLVVLVETDLFVSLVVMIQFWRGALAQAFASASIHHEIAII